MRETPTVTRESREMTRFQIQPKDLQAPRYWYIFDLI